ncbi:MAG: HAD family hydrolase [Alphaproteobacteria bacterium]|nr:HAD family hydrolase [Alphaproteobacteria bacterium]OJV14241.1 MAG: hypothetical protein BGO27_01930 [Alphaproteobacteria bacterium 33-17]
MHKPKAVLFDWDNTIADTWPVIYKALHKTFEDFGLIPWSFEETKLRVAKSMRDSFPELFGRDRLEEAMLAYRRNYNAFSHDLYPIFDGARELLAHLQNEGIYTAVVSNKTGAILRHETDSLDMTKLFNKVIGSLDAKRDKPFPDPVYLALDGSNIEPSQEVWFIGDSHVDVDCAYNTNCFPVFFGDNDDHLEKKAKLVVNHHDKLKQIISEL